MFIVTSPTASSVVRCWLCGLAGLLLAASVGYGQYDPDWSRHFRIGALVGLNIKAEFKSTGGPLNITPHPEGVYDDGYVHPSQNANGQTGYWGYDHSDQNLVASHTLLMHNTTAATSPATSTTKEESALPGIELAYGGNLLYWGRTRIGWDFGFGWLPINISSPASGIGTSSQTIYSFAYDSTVTLPSVPPPYRGGPSQAGEAQIHQTPYATNSSSGPVPFTGTQKLDGNLFTFRLGPTLYWDFSRYFGMSIGAGPALGVLSADLKFDNQTGTARERGQFSGTDVVYGGYVNAMVVYHAIRNGDFYVGAQYMPLGNATISGPGHEGRLKLDGAIYLSAGVNWPF
jgi:hypothetical protein